MKTARKEDGAVLLTTLLVMSIMAVLAVAIMDDVRFAIKRTVNVQSYAQTDWYVKGAGEFAESYISQQLIETTPEQLNAGLALQPPILFPFEGGLMQLSVRDGSQCLSLSDIEKSSGRIVFRRLLTELGWDLNQAARITSVAVDWQDSDSERLPGGAEDYTYLGKTPAYRTRNSSFQSVTELRSLNGMTETGYQALRPFICARNGQSIHPVNVNTLALWQAPLLAAILGGDRPLATAQQVIGDRPAAGYTDNNQFRESPALAGYSLKDAQFDFLSFEPGFIWVEADVSYLQARRKAAFEFLIEEGRAVRLYQGYGDEVFRPVPKPKTTTDAPPL